MIRNLVIAAYLVGSVVGLYFVIATSDVVSMIVVASLILIPLAIMKIMGKL